MRRILVIMIALMLLPPEAEALSCAQVPFDEDAIYHAAVIFEGKVLEELPKKESFLGDLFSDEDGALQGLTPYLLEVTRAWKGTGEGANITVLLNTAWGDRFEPDKDYLVVAIEQDGEYVSPACGHTAPMVHAAEMVKKLEQTLGEDNQD